MLEFTIVMFIQCKPKNTSRTPYQRPVNHLLWTSQEKYDVLYFVARSCVMSQHASRKPLIAELSYDRLRPTNIRRTTYDFCIVCSYNLITKLEIFPFNSHGQLMTHLRIIFGRILFVPWLYNSYALAWMLQQCLRTPKFVRAENWYEPILVIRALRFHRG